MILHHRVMSFFLFSMVFPNLVPRSPTAKGKLTFQCKTEWDLGTRLGFSLIMSNTFYKITKIVCALWLAERSVCMRVCKHGCGVKLFGFSRANHASTNLKKFSSSKLDKFTLFTHSFVGWNMENRYKEGESIFLRLSWHFKREKSVFCKASFCKTRTDYACKTSWTRFCDW